MASGEYGGLRRLLRRLAGRLGIGRTPATTATRRIASPASAAPAVQGGTAKGTCSFDDWSLVPLIADPENSQAKSRLLVFADGPGATQTISFDLPLGELRRSGAVQMLMLSEADFDRHGPMAAESRVESVFADFRPTHVVVSRFGGLGATGVVKSARARGLGFVMHLDDDLFGVPKELGAAKYDKYAEPARRNRLRLLCERAEKVYASTVRLKARLLDIGFSSPVEAGAIYCALPAAPVAFAPVVSAPIFGYMGTSGHAADLEMIVPAIATVLDARPSARFETFGSIKMPKALSRNYGDRTAERAAAGSYLEFIDIFCKTGWACGLAPVANTAFNACKADTKFVEYSVAGIPSVVSDIGVYRPVSEEGRGLIADGVDAWRDAILKLLDDREFAGSTVARAQAYLANAYSMKRLEDQVVAMIGLDI